MSAIIFDCDGVLADTEHDGHLPAFNQTFKEFNLPIQWGEAEYAESVKIGGGKERMASLLTPEFVQKAGLPTDAEEQSNMLVQWHKRKTEIYKEMVRDGRLPGRPGVARLTREAIAAGWTLVAASTSAVESVRTVLEFVVGKERAAHFQIFAGDMVPKKKPAPDIYLLAQQKLNLSPSDTLAIEDSRNGLLAATGAGFRCLVTLSRYTRHEDMSEALVVVSDLGEPNAPMHVIANRSRASLGDYITLNDIKACIES